MEKARPSFSVTVKLGEAYSRVPREELWYRTSMSRVTEMNVRVGFSGIFIRRV